MPSEVQHATNSTTTAGSLTVTFAANVTAGNNVIVAVGTTQGTTAPTVSGVTLGSTAFTKANALAGGKADCEIWYLENAPSGQSVVTVTFTGGSGISLATLAVASEWSGLASSGSLDVHPAGGSGTGTSWSSNSSGTLSQASEVVFGCVMVKTGGGAVTPPGSPWTNETVTANAGLDEVALGYQVVSATTAQTYSGTTGTTANWASVIVSFTQAAAPPAATAFTAPGIGRGRPAAARGTGKGSPGAKYVAFPSHFTAPVRPAKGAPAAVRGRVAAITGQFTHVIPPGPAPFTLPVRPARGQTARRGSSIARPGAPYAAFPARFTPPSRPARGRQAAARGRSASSAGAPWVAPHRTLLIALASAAGTDDYGNAFPQGIFAGAGVIEGPELIGSDAFYYTGTPAAGGLISSVTGAPGTDQFGNAYLAGTTTYGGAAPHLFATSMQGGSVQFWTAASAAGPWSLFGQIEIAPTVAGTLVLDFSSIAGAINTPQASGAPLPLSLPAPSSYSSLYAGDTAAAVNDIWSALLAAGILSS